MRITRALNLLLCLLVTVCCSSIARGQEYDSQIRNRVTDHAYLTLSRAHMFNLGGFGFGLTMTEEEKAFQVLLDSPHSIVLFKRLLNEGNPEGQMYALYGLYLEDRDAFKNEAGKFKLDDGPPERWEGLIYLEKGKIRIGIGCVLSEQDRKMVIARMEQAGFDQSFKRIKRTVTY
jgi:hypothetical protein